MSTIDFKISEEIRTRAKASSKELEDSDKLKAFDSFNDYLILNIVALEYFLEQKDPNVLDTVSEYVDFITENKLKTDIVATMALRN